MLFRASQITPAGGFASTSRYIRAASSLGTILPTLSIRLLILIASLIVSVGIGAQEKKSKKKRKWRSQNAIVKINGASVYRYPNFDSPVMTQFPVEKVVRVSRKVYKGVGGLGLFYKVRVKPRIYGYIADVDIVPQIAIKKKKTGFVKQREKVEENPEFERAKAEKEGIKEVLYSKHVGFVFGGVSYTEEIARSTESANVNTFGLKMVGPGALFDGPPVNFEFTGTATVPSFYEKFANGPVSGFIILSHAAVPVLLPYNKRDTMFAVWLGLMGVYTKFNVPGTVSSPIDSQELRVGLAAIASLTHRLTKKYIFQADYKYYYELNGYSGFSLSIGVEY